MVTNCLEIIYILAISLQVTGAVLLIIKYWEKTIKKHLDDLYKKQNHVKDGGLYIGNAAPSDYEYTYEIVISRMAFIYLAIGYLTGVIGEKGNWQIDLPAIAVLTFLIVIVSRRFAIRFSTKYRTN